MRGMLFFLVCCLATGGAFPSWAMTPQEVLQRRLQKMQEADAALRAAAQQQEEQDKRAAANATPPSFHQPEKLAIPDPVHPAEATPDPRSSIWDTHENTPAAAAPPAPAAQATPAPPVAKMPTPAAKRDPKKARQLAVKAAKAAKAKDFTKALAALDQAVAADPADPELYNNRGNVLANSGRLQDALPDYDRAISMKPSDAAFFTNRGYAYERLGNQPQACADYTKACNLGDCAFLKSYKAEGHCP